MIKRSVSEEIQARYEQWREDTDPRGIELRRQEYTSSRLPIQPLISVIVPVFDPPAGTLRATIDSVLNQTYGHFELCIANAGRNARCAELLRNYMSRDERVRCVTLSDNLGISGNSNAALELATGDFVALLDHDDLLAPDALYRIAEVIVKQPDVDVIYTDEDRVGTDGRRAYPFLKPDWSPELLHSFMWIGHLTVYRRALVDAIGRFRPEYDGSQDYDLVLRAARATQRFAHVRRVLYHWKMLPGSAAAGGKLHARRTNLAALQDAVEQSGRRGRVVEYPWANRVTFDLEERSLVSVIVPSDDVHNIRTCVAALLANSTYDSVEVIVVTNSSAATTLERDFSDAQCVRFLPHGGEFNFSRKCNEGARAASGKYLLFLNDDVVPITGGWIEAMLEYAQCPEVGGVSPKLLYDDDSIQYAGLVGGVPDIVGTAFHTWDRNETSYQNMALCVRNVSCLTGACMLVRADVFWHVGGWDDVNTPISHSDFDLSYRLSEAGFRLVYQPFAELRHLGHKSRREAVYDETSAIRRADGGADVHLLYRWGDRVAEDPFYTPGMSALLYENPVRYELLAPPAVELDHGWWNRPRILLVAHDLSSSGAPKVLLEVAKALRDEGMLVVVASPRGGGHADGFVSAGVPVVIKDDITERPESSERFLRGFDVIAPNTVLNWRAVHAAQKIGKPCIWLVQESRFGIDIVEAAGRGAKSAFSSAERVVFPSNRTAKLYERYGGVSRHTAIHYGISDVRDEIADVAHGDLSEEHLTIVCVGSVEPRKGAHVLIDAFELLDADVLERIRALFVGRVLNHDYAARLRTRAARLPVEFLGEMPYNVALGLVRDSDIVLCTSLDESGPLVVIEAMALGKPIISSAVGAAAEIITSGVDGELVDPGDGVALAERLARLIADESTRRRLGANARRKFENYLTDTRYGRDMTAAFQAVLAERHERGEVLPTAIL